MALPAAGGKSRFLGVKREGPAAAARDPSTRGISVVTFANSEAGLVRVVASQGGLRGPFIESSTTFSEARLSEWSKSYPYGYRQVGDVNEFYTSTSGIGVAEIPDRSVVVASTNLQASPPNLLSVGGDLVGRTRRLASAPSLAWLKAAPESDKQYDGRIAA